ncbi:hypothetical protein [Mycolicibacterium diernhoferi]|uniref:Uncharacterized protein n=1 Tax=Mycolicibacterium diernhoferi TaxID=1801 RepID=A0A1Q4H661_9MYCO|nr:hypothetical protein [Mycolicibacterium diernhoferi]OJZ63046.1 hypothetical protein BRW64_24320 [Mycolicibacterium diernhoferi]OPE54160.1 hypothetical protein BV510_11810 [Mycolicibacterium diernhoferi]
MAGGAHATAVALWLQLHDSAFPAGRMVHSDGLEEWLYHDELIASYKLFDNARTASVSAGRQLAATACAVGIAARGTRT